MDASQVQKGWERVEDLPPAALAEARTQLHHALQLVADAGRKLAAGADAEYLAKGRALATGEVRGARRFRVGLAPADLTLVLLDGGGQAIQRFALAGRTFAEAVAWLRGAVDGLGADGAKITGDAPYELPDHKVAEGAPFAPPAGGALAVLAAHFANAWRVLDHVAGEAPDTSAVRCSPETLDVSASIGFEDDKQIDLGFRPGDAELEEPYFYVALAPPPRLDEDELEALEELDGGGEWRTEEWFGAVQPASAFTIYDTPRAQAKTTVAFFESALEQARVLLGVAEE